MHVIDKGIYILQERVKERNTNSKNDAPFTSSIQSSKVIVLYFILAFHNIDSAISPVIYYNFVDSMQYQDFGGKSSTAIGSAVSFSDDEDTVKASGSKPTRGRKVAAADGTPNKTSTRGRGRGRGRGTSSLKQTTLDSALGFRQSQRYFMSQFI